MGRTVRHPIFTKLLEATPVPSLATVAPHRYLWSGAILPNGEKAKDLCLCDDYNEAKANIPYLEGEVIWLIRDGKPIRALIIDTHLERDRFGDRREFYRVVFETKKDTWSKLWEKTWPGFVQKGYKIAGLAPDVL